MEICTQGSKATKEVNDQDHKLQGLEVDDNRPPTYVDRWEIQEDKDKAAAAQTSNVLTGYNEDRAPLKKAISPDEVSPLVGGEQRSDSKPLSGMASRKRPPAIVTS
eukprot:CAMPEP_0169385934 /NCGR_PEP_ID=MMETSP1017-20121227/44404_1 /TAXON_ID=342587 /ORGANISM="Karlodinium micrum, Strain CCMP2283" /LENGTH=105 /DNA_ID=CAMNT_0009486949 /DNA_START=1 /DNA_END=318 /DNA_ORIENTATION=+